MILHQENLDSFIMLGSKNLFLDFCLMVFLFNFYFPTLMVSPLMSTQCRFGRTEKRDAPQRVGCFHRRRCCPKAPNPWRWRRYKNTWYRDIGTWDPVARQQFGWRFPSIQMAFKIQKDRFPRIMFQEFWQETLQACNTWENVESKHAHKTNTLGSPSQIRWFSNFGLMSVIASFQQVSFWFCSKQQLPHRQHRPRPFS